MSHKNYTFLVVEDNLVMLKMVENMLADIGCQDVIRVRNGKEAWEKIQAPDTQIDLVISDMIMQEEDGMQLLAPADQKFGRVLAPAVHHGHLRR